MFSFFPPRMELLDCMKSVYIFNFLRNCRSVLQSDCIILYLYQQYLKVLSILHSPQFLVLLIIFTLAILVYLKGYLIVILICSFSKDRWCFIIFSCTCLSFVCVCVCVCVCVFYEGCAQVFHIF